MNLFDLSLLIAVGLMLWFWQDAVRTKELAVTAGWRACERVGVVFLDETVEFLRLGIKRTPSGRLGLYRAYRFEFTTDGSRRYQGHISMLGHRLETLTMDPYPEAGDIEPPKTLH